MRNVAATLAIQFGFSLSTFWIVVCYNVNINDFPSWKKWLTKTLFSHLCSGVSRLFWDKSRLNFFLSFCQKMWNSNISNIFVIFYKECTKITDLDIKPLIFHEGWHCLYGKKFRFNFFKVKYFECFYWRCSRLCCHRCYTVFIAIGLINIRRHANFHFQNNQYKKSQDAVSRRIKSCEF